MQQMSYNVDCFKSKHPLRKEEYASLFIRVRETFPSVLCRFILTVLAV